MAQRGSSKKSSGYIRAMSPAIVEMMEGRTECGDAACSTEIALRLPVERYWRITNNNLVRCFSVPPIEARILNPATAMYAHLFLWILSSSKRRPPSNRRNDLLLRRKFGLLSLVLEWGEYGVPCARKVDLHLSFSSTCSLSPALIEGRTDEAEAVH